MSDDPIVEKMNRLQARDHIARMVRKNPGLATRWLVDIITMIAKSVERIEQQGSGDLVLMPMASAERVRERMDIDRGELVNECRKKPEVMVAKLAFTAESLAAAARHIKEMEAELSKAMTKIADLEQEVNRWRDAHETAVIAAREAQRKAGEGGNVADR